MADCHLQWYYQSSLLCMCSSVGNLSQPSSTKPSPLSNLSPTMADIYIHLITIRNAYKSWLAKWLVVLCDGLCVVGITFFFAACT